MGVKTITTEDPIKIFGNPDLKVNKNITIKNYLKDHRVFMTSVIAALVLGEIGNYTTRVLLTHLFLIFKNYRSNKNKHEKFEKKFFKIAIDSPAAAGAGTLAKALAKHYNLAYLDTGKVYRMIALYKIKNPKNLI